MNLSDYFHNNISTIHLFFMVYIFENYNFNLNSKLRCTLNFSDRTCIEFESVSKKNIISPPNNHKLLMVEF
jgi:hypothetical protein